MRLRQIVIAARDRSKVCDELADVFGLGAPFADPGVGEFGLTNAVFPVGDTFLEVVSPDRPDTAAGRFLDRRGGDGGYMNIVQTDDLAAARARVEQLGVRVVWEIAFPDIATIHLHPRDVGGAIVSIDASDPPRSWRWAGPDWETRSRSDVTTAVVGAELVATDPEALAQRWSQVLGRDLDATSDGPEIPLEGGRLRFAAASVAEPEVAAYELSVVDPDAVRARARSRGLVDRDGHIAIGGTRFDLRAA